MYCSQIAWYGWLKCGEDIALNLDHGCPDYDEIKSIDLNNMTPLDALNKLDNWKKILNI